MSAKKKSSKRSGTSPSQPDAPPLFIDRDLWSRRLGTALDSAGVRYIAHRQRFEAESADVEWIAVAHDRRSPPAQVNGSVQQALEKGMESKAVEFVKKGSEIYSKA